MTQQTSSSLLQSFVQDNSSRKRPVTIENGNGISVRKFVSLFDDELCSLRRFDMLQCRRSARKDCCEEMLTQPKQNQTTEMRHKK